MANAVAPSPEDVMEDLILQHEERLEAENEAAIARGSTEGARYRTTLNINGEITPIIDQPDDVKNRVAAEAVKKRAQNYEEETYRYAKFKLSKMNDVEAVDFLRELPPGDREIYLRAELDGEAREDIFAVFGLPEEDK